MSVYKNKSTTFIDVLHISNDFKLNLLIFAILFANKLKFSIKLNLIVIFIQRKETNTF